MATAHCEWGPNGVLAFRDSAKVLIIVDVLSFSTAVDVAVARGAQIVPFPLGDRDAAARAAAEAGALLASSKRAGEQYSLAPSSLETIPAGTKMLLPSPNGSRLSLMGGEAKVFAGCLRNAAPWRRRLCARAATSRSYPPVSAGAPTTACAPPSKI